MSNFYKPIGSFLLVLFCIFQAITGYSQTVDIQFDNISIEDGLSQSTVFTVIQDSKGFLWFGTHDGLNRYDGYSFVVYKNDIQDSSSIAGNIIRVIHESDDGNLWIGTFGNGFSMFDRQTEKFTNYGVNSLEQHANLTTDKADDNSLNNSVVLDIVEDKNGVLWLATEGGGLNKFDPKTKNFEYFMHDSLNPNTICDNDLNDLTIDTQGKIWIAADNGLDVFDPKTKTFTHFKADGSPNSLADNTVACIYSDRKGTMWAGTFNGLSKYNASNNTFKTYRNEPGNPNSLCHNRVLRIFEDSFGKLWIGTSDGVNLFNRDYEIFASYKHDPENSHSLSDNNVASIYEDRAGIIWIGTWERGVNKYDRKAKKFRLYQSSQVAYKKMPDKTVRAIYEDKDNSLWIGFVEGGCINFNRFSKEIKTYVNNPADKKSLSENTVTSFVRDNNGILWISTWNGGVNRAIENAAGEITGFKHYNSIEGDNTSLTSQTIQKIYLDTKNRMWVGTGGGLNIYNREKDNFIQVRNIKGLETSIQNAFASDTLGNVWVGTWGGLIRFTLDGNTIVDKKSFVHMPDEATSLSDSRIISLLCDNKGTIWVGTFGGGFNRIEKIEDGKLVCKKYSEDDGLANNVIYGMFDDEKGNIWLSTNGGVSRFNIEDKTFVNYDESDGLQSSEFFWGAAHKSKSGEIFFGGINGFNAFYPTEIQDNDYEPPVVITDFKMFNTSVRIGSGSPLQKPITETDKIVLTYEDKVISFEFSALHFSVPENNRYAYMLEGFNDEWIETDATKRFATYTNLDPGKYTFRVKGSNSDGFWNDVGTAIQIVSQPPFWETWWFRALIAIALALIVYAIYRWRVKQIENQKIELERQVIARTAEIQQKNTMLEQQKEEILMQSEQLELTNKELEKLSIVARETDNAVFIFDKNFNLEWINEAFTRLYGYDYDEFIKLRGRNFYEASFNPQIKEHIHQCIDNKESVMYEAVSIAKNGDEIWAHTTVTPIIDEHDEIQKFIALDTDIRELKKAEFEIRQQHDKVERQNEHIRGSIRYARTIQRAILPSVKMLEKNFESFIIFRPKDIVSGDFYWFTEIPKNEKAKITDVTKNEDKLIFVAAVDCTGHGVPGAFMSLIGNRLLSEIVREKRITEPIAILDQLNVDIQKALRQNESDNNDGMDVCLCRFEKIDNEKSKVTFGGAHRPLFYYDNQNNEVKTIKGAVKSIGGSYYTELNFEQTEITVSKGDVLYLSSDGFADQQDADRKRFTQRQLLENINKVATNKMSEQKLKLELALDAHQQTEKQRDDITLIGLKI